MKILITGADGLLGSNLVRLLLEHEHSVHVLLHKSSKSTTLDGLKIGRFYGDILDPATIEPAMEGVEAVVHAAAMTMVWPSRDPLVRKINIEGTRNMVEVCLRHKVKRMILIGSGSSIDPESMEYNPKSYPGKKYGLDYIDSKHEAMNIVMDAVKNRGLPALSILPTFMIGSYDFLPSSGQMLVAISNGKLKFYSGGGRNFVYVGDVATAIMNGLTKGAIGEYYIAGNVNLSYKEFFKIAADITGSKAPKYKSPDWVVKLVGRIGDFIGILTGKKPMLSYPMAMVACDNQFIDAGKAVRELDMPQTRIEDAILESYTWLKANGYINNK